MARVAFHGELLPSTQLHDAPKGGKPGCLHPQLILPWRRMNCEACCLVGSSCVILSGAGKVHLRVGQQSARGVSDDASDRRWI